MSDEHLSYSKWSSNGSNVRSTSGCVWAWAKAMLRVSYRLPCALDHGRATNVPPAPDQGAAKNVELAAAPSLAQLPLRGVEMLTLLAFIDAEILTCLKRKPPASCVIMC